MMISTIITLVITMVVDGRDFEHHKPMSSLEECWTQAQVTMENIRSSEHKDVNLSSVGVGCVIDAGNPA